MRIRNVLYAGLAALLLSSSGCTKTDEADIKDLYNVTPSAVRQIDNQRRSIAFILDTSGSMYDMLKGERKIDSAKKSLKEILKTYKEFNDANNNIEAGIFYFSGWATVNNLVPVEKFDYLNLVEKISRLEADSNTPLGRSLAYAERELDKNASGKKYIVLLTDGMNNTGREPSSVWKDIIKTNDEAGDSPTTLYVIAFNTNKEYFKGLEELGAIVYEAKDAAGLSEVLKENTRRILEKY